LGAGQGGMAWRVKWQQPPPFVVLSQLHGVDAQTHLLLTPSTGAAIALMIFVTAFLIGFWCGWMWQQHGRWRRL
jgi:hypothetical protein